MTESRNLTYDEAAAFLNIKRSTLQSLVCRKRIPHIRLGVRFVRFNADALQKWLNERAVDAMDVTTQVRP
jgi:excisionase family DNA binding protein